MVAPSEPSMTILPADPCITDESFAARALS